jgi:hypothetical protein
LLGQEVQQGQERHFPGPDQGRVGLEAVAGAGEQAISAATRPLGALRRSRIANIAALPPLVASATVESLYCQLAQQYVRFRPALDAEGRPVAQDITWYPDWSPR